MAVQGGLDREEFLLRLRGDLIDRIDQERETTVGPILKSRRDFIDLILGDKDFIDYLKQTEEKEKKPLTILLKESRRYLNEIASDYSETFVELWDKLLTWLWKNIYDGVIVDRKGMARIRDISSQMPLVVVPCHRSHVDYLLLSYVFYKENIQLPFVAAGINLSFWPIGYIFRKSGAFFIRRSFKGLDLYAEVFSRYVRAMLAEKMPVEFFIEGGRSRTGKMVMPKVWSPIHGYARLPGGGNQQPGDHSRLYRLRPRHRRKILRQGAGRCTQDRGKYLRCYPEPEGGQKTLWPCLC